MNKEVNLEVNIESLIGKYFNSSILEDEQQALMTWINQSKENELMFHQIREILLVSRLNDENYRFDEQAALEKVKTKVQSCGSFPKFNEIKSDVGDVKLRKAITLSYRWAAVAAMLFVVCGTLFYHLISRSSGASDVYQEIIVPLGSRAKVALPDGSQVNLNAGSTLRYQNIFGLKRRDVWLDGEGFFDVRKSSKPFIVHSGTVQIKAVGTSFNVRAYASDQIVETTLVSGKIVVTGIGQHRETTEHGMTLLPNQKLIVSNLPDRQDSSDESSSEQVVDTEKTVILKKKVNPAPEISWKDNKWVIDREDLNSLAVKLERRFDVEIIFSDEQLKSFRYNGSLPDLSMEQVLKVISMASPIDYSVNEKTVIISEKK